MSAPHADARHAARARATSRARCASRCLDIARARARSSDASRVANDVPAREEFILGRAREWPRVARIARALALELARAEVSDQTRGEARARRGKQSLAEVRGGVRAESAAAEQRVFVVRVRGARADVRPGVSRVSHGGDDRE